MRISISLMGMEFITLDLSVPRFNMFVPGSLPESVEAMETWGVLDDDE